MKENKNFSHFGVVDAHQEYYDQKVEPVKQAMLDGYSFGDTLLEGVMFVFTIEDDSSLSVKVREDSEMYFSTLNQDMWLGRALECAFEQDIFEGMDDIEDIGLIMLDGDYNYNYM